MRVDSVYRLSRFRRLLFLGIRASILALFVALGACAPKGAPWTILCMELDGQYGEQHASQIAETLRRTPGVRSDNVFVWGDSEGRSRIYYGTYKRRTDPRTGRSSTPKRLRDDLALMKQLGPAPGKYWFLAARVVRSPMPDVGRPEWALTRAAGLYSLQVAVFEPSDTFQDYKRVAAEYCEILRQEGYEAYYHHADACSMVTVGTFGGEALIPQPVGLPRYSPEVLALQKDELLKYNYVNGAIVRAKSDTGHFIPVQSRLVKIPISKDATTP